MVSKVQRHDISEMGEVEIVHCDVLIVGGGPAGLTVARGLAGTSRDVLILESGGLEEHPDSEELNEVVVDPGNWSPEQARRRELHHGSQAPLWQHARQGYGLRCRALGGSTVAWAGKSAAFDELDFAERDWVPNSGWPIDHASMVDHVDRAADILKLGVNCYDDQLWDLMGRKPPEPCPDPAVLRSFFWQIARSSIDPMDVMRIGPEFLKDAPEGCRIFTGATVLEVLTTANGKKATGAVVADSRGKRRRINADIVVLAASAIENARLLLNSRAHHPAGIGNHHDVVGRYLMDHPAANIAHFEASAVKQISQHFGFYGLKSQAGINMYVRGLAPTQEAQKADGLLNCSAFMVGERSPDDPWIAAKRIVKRRSESYVSDAWSILKAPGLVAMGLGRLAFQSDRFPKALSRGIVDQVVRFFPNLAVEEYLTKGVPLKLVGLSVQAICEQAPVPENRVFLSSRTDRFGMSLPAVRWRVGDAEERTLIRLGEKLHHEFGKQGLPQPILEDWVANRCAKSAGITDMAHSTGTTRMSDDPRRGVVDVDCKVHGVDGLYVAGASIFPTSGHANPTLMIMAFSHRLAGTLKALPKVRTPVHSLSGVSFQD